jgi:hypothetical protein
MALVVMPSVVLEEGAGTGFFGEENLAAGSAVFASWAWRVGEGW